MKIKIFTQANRCNIFLWFWLIYYSRIVNQSDMYIYYENKFGQDILKYLTIRNFEKVNVIFVDTIIALDYFNDVQKRLLKESDVLLYADPDEFIFSTDLHNILSTSTDSYLTTTGFEIIHNIREELPFDAARPIMKQRSYGVFSESYNKPLILKEPLNWTCTGKHSKNIKMNQVDGLYLIHLCRFDFTTLLKLNRQNKQAYTKNQIKCWHHLITDGQELRDYYSKYFLNELVSIPQEIKQNFDI
jgi:hypothetical protein